MIQKEVDLQEQLEEEKMDIFAALSVATLVLTLKLLSVSCLPFFLRLSIPIMSFDDIFKGNEISDDFQSQNSKGLVNLKTSRVPWV